MKLSLNIESGSLAGRRFELTEGFFTIGRGERCNIRFDPYSEMVASKEHCFIEAKPDGFFISDNRSTNGTIVNGERVASVRLRSGDRIQFGKNGATASVLIEESVSTADQTSVLPNQNSEATQLKIPEIKQSNIATHFYIPDDVPNSQITHVAPKIEPSAADNFTMPMTPPTPTNPPHYQGDFYVPQQNQPFQSRSLSFKNSFQGLGMGGLPPQYYSEHEADKTKKYLAIAGTIFVVIFLSFIVSLLMFYSVGFEAAVMASVVAFIPAMFYLMPLVWLDRYDPEPAWLLALAFAWGALVAVIVSFVVNTLLGSIFGPAFGAVISAPVFEEGSKGLGLLILLLAFRRYFDDILDGIVFAGVIALGFATVENVLYYGRGIREGGSDGLLLLFIVRGIFSPFAHVTFTAMTGIGFGISRESHNMAVRIMLPLVGYFCAVLLHAIWNGAAVIGGFQLFVLNYFFLQIPFFVLFIIFCGLVMWRQNRILKEMLTMDAARGLIPQEHLKTATSAFLSTGWLISGLFSGNFKARSNYLRALGKLGLSYWHMQRATAAQGHTMSFQQNPILRQEVLRWRDQV
jgi:RsiW-degrading membrane proteinase PrsW (M82 family)